ncbi:hypothetical protein PPERSA_07195 [Pseudocohnilembus persalinus]|uniref:Transmembrane protein n=1 Tax=Pseudocohnilembus persalinus TaxID=266149 RepID=A0A0V0QYS0_PSEPJ|nr:hypothetical protein PPERSA_07195 [Pseudocohnilembus persalinus]|eukprot:KRX07032.1 hypothetical protein PPERSA_07195 [Pseudocohnilembus persalinus]
MNIESQIREVNSLQIKIKNLIKFLSDFSQNYNRTSIQYQNIHEYIQKIFVEDNQKRNQAWLNLSYEHLMNVPKNHKIYQKVQENFLELLTILNPRVDPALEDRNLFNIVFCLENKAKTYHDFFHNFWPDHLQYLVFGAEFQNQIEQAPYLNYYTNSLKKSEQQFKEGKLSLDLQEYFIFNFINGLSKCYNIETNKVTELNNLTMDHLFHGVTHNPYLVLLHQYLQVFKKKQQTSQLFSFLLSEYLILANISFYVQFDYMNELQQNLNQTGKAQQKQSFTQQNILQNTSQIGQIQQQPQSLLRTSQRNNSQLLRQSQINNFSNNLMTNSQIQSQQLQQQQQASVQFNQKPSTGISVQMKEYILPNPAIFQALQIIIYEKTDTIHKDDVFRRLIFKFLYCSMNPKYFNQGLATLNDVSKLYLQYLFPRFSLFINSIEMGQREIQEILKQYVQKLTSKYYYYSSYLTSSLLNKGQISKWEPGIKEEKETYYCDNFDNENESPQSQSNPYRKEFKDQFQNFNQLDYQSEIRYHQEKNYLFYTLLLNKFFMLSSTVKGATSQNIYAIFNVLQFFQPCSYFDQHAHQQRKQILFGLVKSYDLDKNSSGILGTNSINYGYNNNSFSGLRQSGTAFGSSTNVIAQQEQDRYMQSLKQYNFEKNDQDIYQLSSIFNNENMQEVYQQMISIIQLNIVDINRFAQNKLNSQEVMMIQQSLGIKIEYIINCIQRFRKQPQDFQNNQNFQQNQFNHQNAYPARNRFGDQNIINSQQNLQQQQGKDRVVPQFGLFRRLCRNDIQQVLLYFLLIGAFIYYVYNYIRQMNFGNWTLSKGQQYRPNYQYKQYDY